MTDKIEFFTYGEWTAAYLNGKLEVVGDHYHSQDWLEDYAKVQHYYTDAFMLGTDGDTIADTVERIEEYQKEQDRVAEATRLQREEKQAEINALRARLRELES